MLELNVTLEVVSVMIKDLDRIGFFYTADYLQDLLDQHNTEPTVSNTQAINDTVAQGNTHIEWHHSRHEHGL